MTEPDTTHKESRAEYFREYRRRKKEQLDASNILQFTTQHGTSSNSGVERDATEVALHVAQPKAQQSKLNVGHEPCTSDREIVLRVSGVVALGIVCLVLTTALIVAAAPAYPGNKLQSYGTAALIEVALLSLICIRPVALLSRMVRNGLVLALVLYTSMPLYMLPLAESATLTESNELIKKKAESIQSEIEMRAKRLTDLDARGKVSLASSESESINELRRKLRDLIDEQRTGIQTGTSNLPAWLVGLQRVLMLAANLILMHQFIHSLKRI
jgi:hypothetical protein